MRIHYQASQILAEAIHAQPNTRYIHISAIGASVTSPALYARTKGMAEESVRAFLPDAMILRPSVVFGPDDSFFNRWCYERDFAHIALNWRWENALSTGLCRRCHRCHHVGIGAKKTGGPL